MLIVVAWQDVENYAQIVSFFKQLLRNIELLCCTLDGALHIMNFKCYYDAPSEGEQNLP
jgi:hypothetical protein